jgi:hypothetical protein
MLRSTPRRVAWTCGFCRGPCGGAALMSVTNDGCVPEEIVEGTGIPGMRRIAAAVGAFV